MAAVQQLALTQNFDALDQKIEQLLATASTRMAGQAKEDQTVSRLPKLADATSFTQPYVSQASGIAKANRNRLVPTEMRKVAEIRKVEDPVQMKLDKGKTLKATAGSEWYNLPKTNLTPELKKDLQLLHMRNVLDPKRHFKSQGKKFKVPEFSQVGTILEGPTEFFSSRIVKRDRPKTLASALVSEKSSKNRFKSKYGEVQHTKTSGKKAHYKAQQAKRKKP